MSDQLTKPKAAFYWCSSCGGCEEAVVDLGERLLDVAGGVDIVFWPVAIDAKYADLENFADGELDVAFINGAIRMSEQEQIARLLRRKAQTVIAFGACAHTGGVPGLANLYSPDEMMKTAFIDSPGVDNPNSIIPGGISDGNVDMDAGGYPLHLPGVYARVKALNQVIDVDYYLPGCPPNPDLLMEAFEAMFEDALPPVGGVLAPAKALCETCPLNESKPDDIALEKFNRPHEVLLDPALCLLAQGVLCYGPATRAGCEAACISAAMPCRGCYGPAPGVIDQGAKLISSLASLVGSNKQTEIAAAIKTIVDPAGGFYRYGLPTSMIAAGGSAKTEGAAAAPATEAGNSIVEKTSAPAAALETTVASAKSSNHKGDSPVISGEYGRPKLAFYWCSSCGGCEEATVDIAENLLDLAGAADIVFWPVAIDAKYDDLRAMDDQSIDISFINGAVRMSEQQEIAELLRRKSKTVIAFGACAHTGGVPGLANFYSPSELMSAAFTEAPGLDNAGNLIPGAIGADPVDVSSGEYKLHLPGVFERVKTLDQTIDVDYYIPGCPPTPELLMEAVTAAFEDALPPKGTVLAPTKALCEKCDRRDSRPDDTKIEKFDRIHRVEVDDQLCFLAQGLLCYGPATRAGCEAACIDVNMPCRGCFGPTPGVIDQGAKMLSSLAGLLPDEKQKETAARMKTLDDPGGYFYRYGLPASILKGKIG